MPVPGQESASVTVRSLNCPNCGATVTVRSFGHAVNVVCGSCRSILDAQDPKVQVLQKFQEAMKYEPLIPLGKRGKLRGVLYEAVGCQRRAIEVDGITYSWGEYVLFNPYKGFLYLTEYDGHWNLVSMLRSLPDSSGGELPVSYLGETYRHFQTADAKTTFVIGEFSWQVRVGEEVEVADFVSPPRVLSSETTKDKEVTWSLGEYMTGADVWKSFALPGEPPAAAGIYENQPTPFAETPKMIWTYCGIFVVLALLLLIFHGATAKSKQVFNGSYIFQQREPGEHSFVTDSFELTGRPAPVKVETEANVDDSWIYLDYALINEDTGQAFDFSKEISYYSGYDEDGQWSEGSTHESIEIPSVPPGNYYLRIEPQSEINFRPISYSVTVIHDAVVLWWFPLAAGLLIVPALLVTWRSMNFEHRRWQESDHGAGFSLSSLTSLISSGDDDD